MGRKTGSGGRSAEKESDLNFLKAVTEDRIRFIINSEFADRCDRNVTDRDEVLLKENLPDNIPLEEEKGSFKQASFLIAPDGSVGIPGKTETVLTMPGECVQYALMSDSGFQQ
ncbi:MAG: hypothetical protein K2N44_19815 [Lachnospiraceae bacterium]|nr:hypothetical protein [Lachnospiraceae bacterium]